MAKLKKKSCRCCDGTGKELDHKAVGDYMRFLRQRIGISQTEVAAKMKLSKPYVSDLEHGFRNWRDELIVKYRKAIGLS